MAKSRRRRRSKNLLTIKTVAPALFLVGLLGYLAVTTFLVDGGSSAVVQRAEARTIETGLSELVEPSETLSLFSTLEDREFIPVPISIEQESQHTVFGQPSDLDTDADSGPIAGAVQVITEPIVEPDDPEAEIEAPALGTLIPTYSWVNAFSADSVLNGAPLPIGSIVTAYDPDGVLIGRTMVTSAGQYGAMALYMDDPSTMVDEGAITNDFLTFKINGLPTVVLGPSAPVWIENGGILVLNLASGDPPA